MIEPLVDLTRAESPKLEARVGGGVSAYGLSIVISSCDAYEDLWKPYFTLFHRYWPDCPFPIYLITNKLKFDDSKVISVPVFPDRGWATVTREALERLADPYILYTHEDFFLDRKVDTSRILKLLDYMKKRGAAYLRLYPSPGPDVVFSDLPEVGEINKGSEYRTCLQAALWKREVMISLIRDGENPWQMEILGSQRSNELEMPFLSAIRNPNGHEIVNPPLSYFCTAVYKGLWMREAVKFCRREGVPIDLKRRGVETVWIETKRAVMRRVNKTRLYEVIRNVVKGKK